MRDTVEGVDVPSSDGSAAPDNCDATMWNEVGGEWVAAGRQRVWRGHSDWIAGRLLDRWMRPGTGAALKTDLFDEALSEGLVDVMGRFASSVHGIDVAYETASAAQRRHPALHARIADIRALPYAKGCFDTVVSLSTLDHFETTEEIERGLSEIRRVTAPGGRLILSLDNPRNPKIALRAWLDDGLLRRSGLVPYHCGATLGPRDMREAVERAGFRVLEETATTHCPRVTAVWLAGQIERAASPALERAFYAALRPFELLERLPTRYLTGHFCALVAEARG